MPVVGNVTAQPLTTVEELRDELGRQMASPVLWTASVRAMAAAGARTFVELGPGAVLSGLIKRIDREVATKSLADLDLGLPAMTP
jgi:[acyl-carrier-protein] S-malonyltransferase